MDKKHQKSYLSIAARNSAPFSLFMRVLERWLFCCGCVVYDSLESRIFIEESSSLIGLETCFPALKTSFSEAFIKPFFCFF